MFNDTYPDELPRVLQHMLERDQIDGPTTLPRRSFLKILGVGGLALGAFPQLALAQQPGDNRAEPLKPSQATLGIRADSAQWGSHRNHQPVGVRSGRADWPADDPCRRA